MQNSFFFESFIYLAGAVIMVPIAQRLKLGAVLGYLFAGVLIGPSVLQLVGTESHDVMHFAEFGVVMLLFVIGLELDPARVWEMRKRIVGLGGLQVLGVTLLVFLLLLGAGFVYQEALAIGIIVAMSSTAIVIQLLDERGWKGTMAGKSAFSVLLFQDMAIIPILALLPLLADGSQVAEETLMSGLPNWGQPLVVVLAVLTLVLMGKYILYPLFRMMAKTRLRELFTAAVLLLVVGTSLLMELVGLSPALGAFLAGVLLANSEYRHEIEIAIDPFKGLLLGLFFMAVGSSLDLGLVWDRPLLIAGLVLGVFLLKGMVHLVLGKFFGLRNAQNTIFSVALGQIGEFSFVLIGFCAGLGIIALENNNILMAVVALSMTCSPIFIMINEKWILPRMCAVEVMGPKPSQPSDVREEHNRVIIAGYGHFGNIVGRFLNANDIPVTVLDNDSDNVDFLRKLGLKVYYGDATRYDLLEIAGARDAEIIVIAIGDQKLRLQLVDTIKKHFPHLYTLVRASNRDDAYKQMNAGIMHIYRETVDTSLRVGVDVLDILGFERGEAETMAKTFLFHDEKTLKHLSSIRNDEEYIHVAKEKIAELNIIIKSDKEKFGSARIPHTELQGNDL
ncbi:MAG: monovalent cation:proton antiporter-2 (CPA2) family protein [Sediminicola sp.]